MEKDPTLIVSAASQAQRGFDWMMGIRYEEQESLGEAEGHTAAVVPNYAVQKTEKGRKSTAPAFGR